MKVLNVGTESKLDFPQVRHLCSFCTLIFI